MITVSLHKIFVFRYVLEKKGDEGQMMLLGQIGKDSFKCGVVGCPIIGGQTEANEQYQCILTSGAFDYGL